MGFIFIYPFKFHFLVILLFALFKVLPHNRFFFNLKTGPPLWILVSPLWKVLHRQKEQCLIPQGDLNCEDSAWHAGGSQYLLTKLKGHNCH